MISILIADDEVVIINGLKKLLAQSDMELDVVFTCTDGLSAWNAIYALHPDIALLDISMPDLNGLEIIEKINEYGLSTDVIFISGFQDFSYARTAIHYGAIDYILKPVIKADLFKAITRCRAFSINKEKPYVRTEPAKARYSEFLNENISAMVCILVESVQKDASGIELLSSFSLIEKMKHEISEVPSLHILDDPDHLLVLGINISQKEAVSLLEGMASRISNDFRNYQSFIVSEEFSSLSEIEAECRKCISCCDYSFFVPFTGRLAYAIGAVDESQPNSNDVLGSRDRLYIQLLGHDFERFRNAYEDFMHILASYPYFSKEQCLQYLASCFKVFFLDLADLNIHVSAFDDSAVMERAADSRSFLELHDTVWSVFEDAFQHISLYREGKANKEYVIAVEYIEKHYQEQICLKNIADYVGMNTYYFSSYFKKNVGINFKDFLKKVRLKHAMNLILSTDMLVSEIAHSVGFMDVRTFSDTFQKEYGEKPSDYIRRVRSKANESDMKKDE